MRAAPDPRILTGWSGASPHVLRFPLRAFLRFPFVRRSPVRSLRPSPGFRVPFGVPPVSLPLGNLHDSSAGGRFRRRWSRAARAKVTSPAATTPRLDLAVIRPALQMGNGRARGDAATESPVTSGREPRTPPRPNRPDWAVTCAAARRGGSYIRGWRRDHGGWPSRCSAASDPGSPVRPPEASGSSPALLPLRARSLPGRSRPAFRYSA
jgi:hypothetical protein